MREIKFRAWNEVTEKMLTWNEFLNTNMKQTFIAPESTALILMQYTGLEDKNGKEIYEGDIVKIPNDWEEYGWASGEKYEIDYKNGRFRLKPKYKPNAIGYDLENTEELEVIGNIHENKNLLEENNE